MSGISKEKAAAYNKMYYAANKAKIKEWHARPENVAKHNARMRLRTAAGRNVTPNAKENLRMFRARHQGHNNANAAKHRALKKTRMPTWANSFLMKQVYSLAKLRSSVTGFVWHVDHIVPLTSDLVCGLHWEGNMQVIPGSANCSKQNRFWPDMP